MTSSDYLVLAPGAWYGTFKGLQEAVVTICSSVARDFKIKRHYDYEGPQRTAAKRVFQAVCSNVGCDFGVKASKNRAGDKITISRETFSLTHTCDGPARKQNYYLGKQLRHNLLDHYEPLRKDTTGNAAQLQRMLVKGDNGKSITIHQARRVVQQKRCDAITEAIKEYELIESYMHRLHDHDPAGRYEVDVRKPAAKQSAVFHRLVATPSAAKKHFQHSYRQMVTVDGAHLKSSFGGVLLSAVSQDANNHLVILSFAIVQIENEENWLWFTQRLTEDFPSMKIIMSDGDKGLHSSSVSSHLALRGVAKSRCVRHLIENVRLETKSVTKEIKSLIYKIATARTRPRSSRILEKTKKICSSIHDCIVGRLAEFQSCHFIDQKLMRFGATTNNHAEQINNVLLEARTMPILRLVQMVLQIFTDQYVARKLAIRQRKMLPRAVHKNLTDQALATIQQTVLEAQKLTYDVKIIDFKESPDRIVEVKSELRGRGAVITVNKQNHSIQCSCRHYEETGFPCVHAVAVILYFQREGWDIWEIEWIHEAYHLETWNEQYDAEAPQTVIPKDALEQSTLLPPIISKKRGRPKLQRYKRKCGALKRKCGYCGGVGHYCKTCPRPDFHYLIAKERRPGLESKKDCDTFSREESRPRKRKCATLAVDNQVLEDRGKRCKSYSRQMTRGPVGSEENMLDVVTIETNEHSAPEIDCGDTTVEMEWTVEKVIATEDNDVVVQNVNGHQLYIVDMKRLLLGKWLTDAVINSYLCVLKNSLKYSNIGFFNSFFFSKLCSSGFSAVRCYVKESLWKYSRSLFPLHIQECHFALASVEVTATSISLQVYDSMSLSTTLESVDRHFLPFLRRYKQWYPTRRTFPCKATLMPCPQQTDGSSCGVYVCCFARQLAAGESLSHPSDDHRIVIAKQLLAGELR